MENKSLGVFNMAFVDILAGALGAVILLFVIVPKMDSSSAEALEKVAVLQRHSVSLDSIIADIAYLIPREKAEELRRLNDSIKGQINDLKLDIDDLSSKNTALEEQVEGLDKELTRSKWKTEYLEKELEKYKKVDVKEMEDRLKEKNAALDRRNREIARARDQVHTLTDSIQNDLAHKTDVTEKGETMWLMGMNPDMAVMIEWEDDNADVDLYLESEGKFCDEENRVTRFGQWVKLPRRMRVGNSEFIIQKELTPGTYGVYAHLYRPKKGGAVEITGSAFLHPDRTRNNKAEFGTFTLTNTKPPYKNGGGTKLGVLIVNEKSIQFVSNQNLAKN